MLLYYVIMYIIILNSQTASNKPFPALLCFIA